MKSPTPAALAFDHAREITASALAGWLDAGWRHEGLDERLPRTVAERLLADADSAVCYQLDSHPPLAGRMLLVASAASLGRLAARLLGHDETSVDDGDGPLAETTAAAGQETANVLASAYLNGLGETLGAGSEGLLPSPPELRAGETPLCWHEALRAQGEGAAERLVDWTRFTTPDGELELYFLFVPEASGLDWLTARGAGADAVPAAGGAGATAKPGGENTLLLADANLITRVRLREAAVTAGLAVAAEAVDAAGAADAAARTEPAWAVLDLTLPGAAAGAPAAVDRLPSGSRWIALAPSSAPERLAAAVATGAWDFLLRPVPWPRLVALCDRLAAGDGRRAR